MPLVAAPDLKNGPEGALDGKNRSYRSYTGGKNQEKIRTSILEMAVNVVFFFTIFREIRHFGHDLQDFRDLLFFCTVFA